MSRTITVTHNGVEYEAEICVIERTTLGYEDHGIFTAEILVVGAGWGQTAGCYALGGLSTHAFVAGVLDGLGHRSWESLEGTGLLALRTSYGGRIEGLADLHDENKVVIFEELMAPVREVAK